MFSKYIAVENTIHLLGLDVDVLFHFKSPLLWLVFVLVGLLTLDFLPVSFSLCTQVKVKLLA